MAPLKHLKNYAMKTMLFDLPRSEQPIIKVIGIGGGGSNAVNYMFEQGIVGVDFAICNTDKQALHISKVPNKIILGPHLTDGRGAGARPEIGKEACIESIEDVRKFVEQDTKMIFITAGMGGGTGTGAAPIIAQAAKEMDILTVGIVTLPFTFEGRKRAEQAAKGLEELRKYVDCIIIISNDKLREMHGNLKLSEAFAQADGVLTTAAKGIAEIITVPGVVNVDFEDVNTVMRNSGVAIMGSATMEGENRAKKAIEAALNSPLLEENDITGAQHILINISSGAKEVTMDEIFEITEYVQEEAGYGTDLIWGNCYDERLEEKLSVTIIATGFEKRDKMFSFDESKRKVSLDHDPKPEAVEPEEVIFETDSSQIKEPRVIEFTDIEKEIKEIRKENYNYENPYIREIDKERQEEERKRRVEAEFQKRKRNKEKHDLKLTSQKVMQYEKVPAYVRQGIILEDVPNSNVDESPTLSISEDGEVTSENSFLNKITD